MLYLAEVQKETNFVKGTKTKLKLLACQRSEQSWSAVPGEEVIQSDEANKFNEGALVLVDLTANKQIQRLQEAARPLVSTLQNFSRLQEKSKAQEEEIEQWKQSLTYQSQELNRRETEIDARQSELEQMAQDLEKLDQQRQEVDANRIQINQLREEIERNRRDLEGAWEHFRGEQRRLEERQSELNQSATLDDEQSRKIQELLNRLSGAVMPTEAIREQLNLGVEIVDNQQAGLYQSGQQLEQQRATAQQLQGEVEQQSQRLQSLWQDWQQGQANLEQILVDLRVQQGVVKTQQEYAQTLSLQMQHQEALHLQLVQLQDPNQLKTTAKVDTATLEAMSLEELQGTVQELQKDLEKLSHFVNDQEEELTVQQQTIDELTAKMQQASEYDRLSLDTELADEQESYKMLNDTLEGQRRNLREREEILSIHQAVLARRLDPLDTGKPVEGIDLEPIIAQLFASQQDQAGALQHLTTQIENAQSLIEQMQTLYDGKAQEQQQKQDELKQLEQTLFAQQRSLGDLWGQVNTYQSLLEPVQNQVNEVRQRLDAIAGVLSQSQEASDYQLQTIVEMRQVFASLINTPEFVA